MEPILKDISLIIQKHKDLNKLFNDADNLISYILNQQFSPYEFYQSLSILGGEEFTRIVFFCLRNFDDLEDFDYLLKQGVDEELTNRLTTIVAKYKAKFQSLMAIENNPFGWKNLNAKSVKIGNKNLMDLEIKLNNNNVFIIREEPFQHIELFRYGLEELKKLKSTLSEEELDDLHSSIEELKGEINNFK